MKKSPMLSSLLAGGTSLLVFLSPVAAQTITPLNPTSPVVTDTIPGMAGPAGTTGADGYDLFYSSPTRTNGGGAEDPSFNVASLPSYVTGLTLDSTLLQYVAFTDPITVGSTSYNTGLIYSPTYGVTAANPQTFLNFELTGSVPKTFDLGVLHDYNDNSLYTVSLYSGAPSALTLLSSTPISDGATDSPTVNEFYYGQISGATAGDYIVITGAPSSGANQVTLGAITFDTVVPEPSTYAMLFVGLGALVVLARLRRA